MDDISFNLLKLFQERNSLSLIELGAILNCSAISLAEPIHYLREMNYLRVKSFHQDTDDDSISLRDSLAITFEGKAALEIEQKSRRHFKYTEYRAWITLAIAILAFILSVISLLLS